MSDKQNDSNSERNKAYNRLIFYIFCFSVVPGIFLAILENHYHLFYGGKRYDDGGPLIIGVLFAVFLWGVVVVVWRMANRPKPLKPPAQIIEKVIVQQVAPAKPTPVQQPQKKPNNIPKPTPKV